MMTPPRISRTRTAKNRVSTRKTTSPSEPCRPACTPLIAMSAGMTYTILRVQTARPNRMGGPAASLFCDRSGAGAVPHRLAFGTDDPLPALFEQSHGILRHRNVIERFRQLAAVLVSPIEKVQDFLGPLGTVLLFVHEDESCGGNWAAFLACL